MYAGRRVGLRLPRLLGLDFDIAVVVHQTKKGTHYMRWISNSGFGISFRPDLLNESSRTFPAWTYDRSRGVAG